MVFPSAFSIIVGVGMIGQWAFSYFSKAIPEMEHEPIRIWFHIAAEMATAASLIVGGLGLLLKHGWGKDIYLIASGMLFYTTIVSPGYFAQKGRWGWLGIFAVVILLGLAGVVISI